MYRYTVAVHGFCSGTGRGWGGYPNDTYPQDSKGEPMHSIVEPVSSTREPGGRGYGAGPKRGVTPKLTRGEIENPG